MNRVKIATLVAALIIFSNCTNQENSNRGPTPEPSSTSSPLVQTTATPVTVFFSGLMVFHKEEGKPSYEVGILGTQSHTFSVVVDSVRIHNLPEGSSWILEITNPQPQPAGTSPTLGNPIRSTRKTDDKNGQYDFSWIIDLEGKEFHDKELELKPGLLKPIIHLPNGVFYTRYKSMNLQRAQGIKPLSDFGFVPETIALHLELRTDQELVLKDANNGKEAFRLKYNDSPPPFSGYVVNISNVKHVNDNTSDFKLYYGLFTNVPQAERYDFAANINSTERPHNPLPGHRHDQNPGNALETCCSMTCTEVLLGRRIKALE